MSQHSRCCDDRLKSAQYARQHFQELLADNGVTCSMSRSGNVWDNAAMESFFLLAQDRADQGQGLPDQGRRQGRCVRLHREVLQHVPPTLGHRQY
jgi:transposase InsO family protein